MQITAELLRRIAPVPRAHQTGQRRITDAIAPLLNDLLPRAGIAGPWRVAHFLAQAAHETDGFSTLEEYASGQAYEGRADLGNTQPGDGKRFKGRGIFQTTGRFNYGGTGADLGVDLIATPARLIEPLLAVKSAIFYWNSRDLSLLADGDHIIDLTRRINGGLNGLADRQKYLDRIQKELFDGAPKPLRRPSTGTPVKTLQQALNGIHYFSGEVDGVFGPRTDDAVRAFQRDHRLKIDGVAGPLTWAKLGEAVANGRMRAVTPVRAHASLTDLAQKGSRIATSSLKGSFATIGAVLGAAPLVLIEAAGIYRSNMGHLEELLAPFGGPDRIAVAVLLAASVFSAIQHIRAGRARTDDHQTGKTL